MKIEYIIAISTMIYAITLLIISRIKYYKDIKKAILNSRISWNELIRFYSEKNIVFNNRIIKQYSSVNDYLLELYYKDYNMIELELIKNKNKEIYF